MQTSFQALQPRCHYGVCHVRCEMPSMHMLCMLRWDRFAIGLSTVHQALYQINLCPCDLPATCLR